jgi:hypothetical protein
MGLIQHIDTPKADFYRPTKYGKEIFSQATGHLCYDNNNDTFKHNSRLLDIYHGLDESEQNSYKTEADLQR